MRDVLNLFAGAGGSCLGIEAAGYRSHGVEYDKHCRKTREVNGLSTIAADVRDFLGGRDDRNASTYHGVWASPPCPSFSVSGNGHGRDHIDHLISQIPAVWRGGDILELDQPLTMWSRAHLTCGLHVLRIARLVRPRWLIIENVREYAPVLRAIAETLDGWWTWVGTLSSEQYGVPQARKRSFLLASREHPISPPEPTHQALWGDDSGLPPALTVADVLQRDDLLDWMYERPSTTIMSKKHLVPPGAHRQGEMFFVSVSEMAALQGFPPGFEFLASNQRFRARMVGNAVPPAMAEAVVRQVA